MNRVTCPRLPAFVRSLLSLACVISLASCGGGGDNAPPLVKVNGKVTSKGEPVSEGVISFSSSKGINASAELQTDGTYVMKSQWGNGMPAGDYSVMISPPAPKTAPGTAATEKPAEKDYPQIPKKYRAYSTSRLEAKVAEGKSTFDFDMKDE